MLDGNKDAVQEVLKKSPTDWDGDVEDLVRGAKSANRAHAISTLKIWPGEQLPWMAMRSHHQPAVVGPWVWDGKGYFTAYSFVFTSKNRKWKLIAPTPCGNFWVVALQSSQPNEGQGEGQDQYQQQGQIQKSGSPLTVANAEVTVTGALTVTAGSATMNPGPITITGATVSVTGTAITVTGPITVNGSNCNFLTNSHKKKHCHRLWWTLGIVAVDCGKGQQQQ